MLNICLVGSGGVGTIASLVLEKSRRAKVTSVLRSNFAVVNEKGFDIESVDHGKLDGWKPTRIVPSISEAAKHGPYDFIIITTRSLPDMTSLPDLIRPIVTKYTTGIVLLQSGLDIEIPIIKAFPKCLVMSGVSMIGVRIRENEVVQEEADIVVFGPHIHSGLGERLQREKAHLFVEIYSSGSCKKCTYTPTILQTRWLSLLHHTPLSILCTLTRLDIGSLLRGGGTSTLLKPAMLEMQTLAKAAGYEVAQGFVDEILKGVGTESSIKPSMLVDLEMGRPLELEVVLGVPLRYAREFSVECPVLKMVYDLLRLTEFGILQNGLQRRITAE